MNPQQILLDLLTWLAIVAVSAVILAIATLVVLSFAFGIRSALKNARTKGQAAAYRSHPIIPTKSNQ